MGGSVIRRGAAAVLVLAFLGGAAGCEAGFRKTRMELGGVLFSVEIADTPAKQARGLMFRKELGAEEGMLFVFDRDRRLSFWMKNTTIPLSLAYLSADGTVREIFDLAPESLRPVESSFAVRFALEVNRGAFARLGIKPGDKIQLPPEYRGAGPGGG